MRPKLTLTRQDLVRLRHWRSALPLPTSAFSWTSALVAATTSALLAVALLADPGFPRHTTTESYAVALLPRHSPSVLSEPVPKEEPEIIDAPSQEHEENAQSTHPKDDPDDTVVEVESSRDGSLPEPFRVVQHAPTSKPQITAAAVSNMRSNYWSEVYAAIANELRYPAAARMQGLEGEVTVLLRIDAHGHLQQIDHGETSASVLSRAVDSAALRAAPYPEPPEELVPTVELEIPVSFRLR